MSSNIFKVGQHVRFRNVGDGSWSASYVVRAVTPSGLIVTTSIESKFTFVVHFENTEFQTMEVDA